MWLHDSQEILHGCTMEPTNKKTNHPGNDLLQISKWEEMFAIHLIEKKLIYIINKQVLQINRPMTIKIGKGEELIFF